MSKTQRRALQQLQRMLTPTEQTTSREVIAAMSEFHLKLYLDTWVRPLVDALVRDVPARELEQILF